MFGGASVKDPERGPPLWAPAPKPVRSWSARLALAVLIVCNFVTWGLIAVVIYLLVHAFAS